MFHAPIVPRARKRPRPVEAGALGKGEVKFEDVRLYLVERKMGRSRRSFLTQLARSKGFIVEDVLRLEKHCHSVYHYFVVFFFFSKFIWAGLGAMKAFSIWKFTRTQNIEQEDVKGVYFGFESPFLSNVSVALPFLPDFDGFH